MTWRVSLASSWLVFTFGPVAGLLLTASPERAQVAHTRPKKDGDGLPSVSRRKLVLYEMVNDIPGYQAADSVDRMVWLAPDAGLVALLKRHRPPEEPGEAIVFDAQKEKILARLAFKGDSDATPEQIVYGPDGKKIALGFRDGRLRLWNFHADTAVLPQCPFDGELPCGFDRFGFSPDGKFLIGRTFFGQWRTPTCKLTPQIVVWDAATGKLIRRFGSKEPEKPDSDFSYVRGNWRLCDDNRHILIAEGKERLVRHRDGLETTVECKIDAWDFRTGEYRGTLGRVFGQVIKGWGLSGSYYYEKLREVGALGDGLFGLRLSPHERMMIFPRLPAGALKVCGYPSDPYGREPHFIVGDRVTGEELMRITDGVYDDLCLHPTLSADSNTLAAGAWTLSLWDLTAVRKHAARERPDLPAGEWNTQYDKLGDAAPLVAFKAMRRLAASPRQSLAILKERLKPVVIDRVDYAKVTAQLDSDDFTTRAQAQAALIAGSDDALADLEKALKTDQTLEARRRTEAIIKEIKDSPYPDAGTRRLLWTIEMLEFLGKEPPRSQHLAEKAIRGQVRQLLERLSEGTPTAWVTLEARAARGRLKK